MKSSKLPAVLAVVYFCISFIAAYSPSFETFLGEYVWSIFSRVPAFKSYTQGAPDPIAIQNAIVVMWVLNFALPVVFAFKASHRENFKDMEITRPKCMKRALMGAPLIALLFSMFFFFGLNMEKTDGAAAFFSSIFQHSTPGAIAVLGMIGCSVMLFMSFWALDVKGAVWGVETDNNPADK
ncbi:hypothetical protein ONV78_09620 [Hahella sp. CR1]|uniref:hypothetical protein n=1 Tax=Hahella sp. CR1 TaxID=2992807 RepID=UPI00244226C0|nr:hypothetical protein [Hahella sp. CR1]MDG9667989.1 hypothetical protein [Hahella sp. CR1]